MLINKEVFKKNLIPIVLLLIIVIGFLVLSLLIPKNNQGIIDTDLPENITSKINKLVINEIMSSNGGVISAPNGGIYDWIELYNGKDVDINLTGYGLSDEPNRVKWAMDNVTIKAKTYLIIFLVGNDVDGLYANFSLRSGGGETLSLRNPNGKVVDAFKTEKIKKNNSFIRDENGKWLKTNKPTPGYDNSNIGYNEYIESLTIENTGLEITEILPRNKGNFIGEENSLYGFIEITNNTGQEINLENYTLSNTSLVPFKYVLPNKKIKNKESVAVYTTNNQIIKNDLYTDFNLSNKTGEVVLGNDKGKIIDLVKYQNLPSGMSLNKQNGNFKKSSVVSPGYRSTNEYQENHMKNKKDLIINEVMNTNTKYIPQNGYQFYDLIELRNASEEDINLKKYHLSSDEDFLNMYNLPDKILKPNEVIVLIASGNASYTNDTYFHTNFKIPNQTGLYLTKNDYFIDSVFVSNIKVNQSLGRGSDNGFFYFETPTPGEKNSSGYREISYTPEILTKPGVFNDNKEVKIVSNTTNQTFYTIDGSIPTRDSKLLPVELKINKTTVLKVASYEENKQKSEIITNSYIVNENHTLPIISVSLEEEDFDYINKNNWETGLKVPAYAEFYEKGKSFSVPCGLKLFGGSTRGDSKKSYALKFKKEYGLSKLDYKVFDKRESNLYDTVVIRSGSQDASVAMIRDELATSIANMSTTTTQDYKATVLYINGEYWGVYF